MPTVVWLMNNKPLKKNIEDFPFYSDNGVRKGRLSIQSGNFMYSGTYTLIVNNSLGMDERNQTIFIPGPGEDIFEDTYDFILGVTYSFK